MKNISLTLFFIFFANFIFAQKSDNDSYPFDNYYWDNKQFPLDTLYGFNNDTLILSQLENTIVVINFWTTYCQPCLSEINQLNILKEKYDSYKVKFIAISYEEKKDIEATLKNHPFNFLHFNVELQLLNSKKITKAFPTNLILDQNKVVKFFKFGGTIDKEREEEIRTILSKEIEKLHPTKITH